MHNEGKLKRERDFVMLFHVKCILQKKVKRDQSSLPINESETLKRSHAVNNNYLVLNWSFLRKQSCNKDHGPLPIRPNFTETLGKCVDLTNHDCSVEVI